jgi:hypothetical protein
MKFNLSIHSYRSNVLVKIWDRNQDVPFLYSSHIITDADHIETYSDIPTIESLSQDIYETIEGISKSESRKMAREMKKAVVSNCYWL